MSLLIKGGTIVTAHGTDVLAVHGMAASDPWP